MPIWDFISSYLCTIFETAYNLFSISSLASPRIQAYALWWRASGDDVKPSLGMWRECHPTFQLTKHCDYRSRHHLVDDLTVIGSAALVAPATAGSTNSARTISAHLLPGVVTLERRYTVLDDYAMTTTTSPVTLNLTSPSVLLRQLKWS